MARRSAARSTSAPTPASSSTRSDPARKAGRALLAGAVLGALDTANARKPLSRSDRGGTAAFFPGWLTSELPLHAVAWQALATARFVRKGALRTPAGWAGLAVAGASWVGLAKMWQDSKGSGAVLEAALRDGLGDELDAGQDATSPRPDVALSAKRLVAGPVSGRRRRFVKGAPISYGEAGRRNQLDIWKSPDLPVDGKAPVLVQVHGGAWVIGNKEQQATPLMEHMAERGWICVAINYRLSPRATWPDQIVDVKRALAWVKDNIAQHGGDPDFVCITGGSAGGHLASLAALSANEPSFQPGFEEADTSVAAAVPIYGVYDWTNRDGTGNAGMEGFLGQYVLKSRLAEDRERWEQASTMSWISADAPPFFVIHGANDTLVPVAQARSFVSMLRAESKNPVAYAELPGAQHAFEVFDSPRTMFTIDAIGRFLESVRARTA